MSVETRRVVGGDEARCRLGQEAISVRTRRDVGGDERRCRCGREAISVRKRGDIGEDKPRCGVTEIDAVACVLPSSHCNVVVRRLYGERTSERMSCVRRRAVERRAPSSTVIDSCSLSASNSVHGQPAHCVCSGVGFNRLLSDIAVCFVCV